MTRVEIKKLDVTDLPIQLAVTADGWDVYEVLINDRLFYIADPENTAKGDIRTFINIMSGVFPKV